MAQTPQTPQEIAEMQRQIKELQAKLDRSNRVTSALISGEREEKLLYKWKAPTRVYLKRDKQWYWSILLIFLIASIILLYIGEPILVIVLLSVLFVLYVSSLVPPETTEHNITSLGIRTFGELYTWDMLKDFWISYKNGREILNVDTSISSPTRLIFLFSAEDKPYIVNALKQKLKYMDAPLKQGKLAKLSEGTYIPLVDIESTMIRRA